MTFRYARDQLLGTPVLIETPFDFKNGGAGPCLIGLVHDHDVGEIEHDDLLQLQARAVIWIHNEHGLIDDPIFLERHRFLSGTDGFDDDIIETGVD